MVCNGCGPITTGRPFEPRAGLHADYPQTAEPDGKQSEEKLPQTSRAEGRLRSSWAIEKCKIM
jgi:hypothetical protein